MQNNQWKIIGDWSTLHENLAHWVKNWVLYCAQIFPTEFAKKWIPSGTQQVRLTKNARRWAVSWDETQQRRPSLGNGWSRFAKENELRDGDVCVLELVHPVRVEFRVHLFRIADYVFKDPAPDQRFVDPPGSRMSPFNGIGVANGCKSAAESSRAGSLRGRKSIAVDAKIGEAVNAFQLRNPHIPIVMRVGHIIRQYNVVSKLLILSMFWGSYWWCCLSSKFNPSTQAIIMDHHLWTCRQESKLLILIKM